MASLFLKDNEIEELTGFKRKKEQRKWLEENSIPHYIARNGRPVIKRSEMTGNTTNRIIDTPQEPNFGAI